MCSVKIGFQLGLNCIPIPTTPHAILQQRPHLSRRMDFFLFTLNWRAREREREREIGKGRERKREKSRRKAIWKEPLFLRGILGNIRG